MNDVTVIEPRKGWQSLNLFELIRYRDLLYFLTIRSIKAKYAQSILGVGWAVLQPLIQTLVFTIIFGNLAQLDSENNPYLLFSFVAMVPWNYFSNILTESSNSLVQNRNLLSKVYFPRMILPLSAVFSKLLDFAIGMIVLFVFLIFFRQLPSSSIFLFPVILMILIMNSLGVGLILSALAVQYRDVQYVMTFLVRVLMYAAPVVYSINLIPEKFMYLYALNPMVGVIEGMRAMFLDSKSLPVDLLMIGGSVSLIVLVIGAFYFKKMEGRFADLA